MRRLRRRLPLPASCEAQAVLERAGRVARRLVAGDRRAVAVAITELAEQEVRDTIGVTDDRLEAAAQRLTPSELRHVEAFLRAVTDAVGSSAAA